MLVDSLQRARLYGLIVLAFALAGCPVDDRIAAVANVEGVGGDGGSGGSSGAGKGGSSAMVSDGGGTEQGNGGANIVVGNGGANTVFGNGGASGSTSNADAGVTPLTEPDAGEAPPVDPPFVPPAGPLTGELSGNAERVKVFSEDGKSYIIQNNKYGGDEPQRLSYVGPTFILEAQPSVSASGGPVSYPSIFIGRNGDQGPNGELTTSADDNLPLRVSDITRISGRFAHNANGDAVALFELWFAAAVPTETYTSVAAAVMVWLYRPLARNPYGNLVRTSIVLPGVAGTWDLWIGPNFQSGGAMVYSYVATQPIRDADLDLLPFVTNAQAQGGPTPISSNMFLTDVFGGFEVYSGSVGLSLTELSLEVQ